LDIITSLSTETLLCPYLEYVPLATRALSFTWKPCTYVQ